MKNEKRLIALILAVLMMGFTIAGYAQAKAAESQPAVHADAHDSKSVVFGESETTRVRNLSYVEPAEEEIILIDFSALPVPLSAGSATFTIPVPRNPGTLTKSNSKATIDYSNSAEGYIMVGFASRTTKELRVLITGPSGTQYQYTLKKDGTFEVYPLTDGNGKYTVGVFEQVDGNRFATAVSGTIDVKLTNEFAPFIGPNQYINFNKDSKVVAKAAELTKDTAQLRDRVSAIYDFVIKNISYDKELAANVKSGYLPDVDAVMARGKGICFDYAALMTAMLRSLNIPTRLVVGYAGTAYHAWIDVYSEEEGWINNIIFFDGKNWNLMDPTFASSGNQSA